MRPLPYVMPFSELRYHYRQPIWFHLKCNHLNSSCSRIVLLSSLDKTNTQPKKEVFLLLRAISLSLWISIVNIYELQRRKRDEKLKLNSVVRRIVQTVWGKNWKKVQMLLNIMTNKEVPTHQWSGVYLTGTESIVKYFKDKCKCLYAKFRNMTCILAYVFSFFFVYPCDYFNNAYDCWMRVIFWERSIYCIQLHNMYISIVLTF